MSLIAVRPRKDSRGFKNNIIQEFYDTPEAERDGIPSRTAPYEGERWGDTIVDVVPIYWHSKGRFKMVDPLKLNDKIELMDEDDQMEAFEYLNKLVKKCKLRHEDRDHPDFGKYIESTDIFDENDPFMRHTDTLLSLNEGSAFVDDEKPMNKIMLAIMLGQDDYDIGGAKHTSHLNAKVKYLLVDTRIDRKIKKDKRTKVKEVHKIVDSLSFSEQVKFAIALGILQDPNIKDQDLVDELLYEYGMNVIDLVEHNKTKQDYFIEMAKKSNLIEISYIFTQALNLGIIKRKDLTYQAFGYLLGKTKDDSISYLTMPVNAEQLEKIQAAVVKMQPKQTNVKVKDNKKSNTKIEDE